jgi:hypothetical protein
MPECLYERLPSILIALAAVGLHLSQALRMCDAYMVGAAIAATRHFIHAKKAIKGGSTAKVVQKQYS